MRLPDERLGYEHGSVVYSHRPPRRSVQPGEDPLLTVDQRPESLVVIRIPYPLNTFPRGLRRSDERDQKL